MRKKDFQKLSCELAEALSQATHKFFEERGYRFDEEAYWAQASVDRKTVAQEMLFFGIDKFPMRPDDDPDRPGDPKSHH